AQVLGAELTGRRTGQIQVGGGVAGRRDGRRVRVLPGQPRAVRVVDIDDPGGRATVEQQCLGPEVALHVVVEVQVVLGQIGEGADREVGTAHPPLDKRVRGDL